VSDDVRELIRRLAVASDMCVSHTAAGSLVDAVGPVRSAARLAEHLWTTKYPEDDDTAELRRQLRHLGRHGKWAS